MTRVYVDGVFDLFHIGHIRLLERARSMGDTLTVGVLSDESAGSYKPRPVLTLDERAEVLRFCRLIDEVIEDAPLCPGEAYLRNHGIDLVVHGDENLFEHEYADPIRMGIMRYVPYTPEISSTDIRQRILDRFDKDARTLSPR